MRWWPGQGHGEKNSSQPRPCCCVLAKTTMKHLKSTSMACPLSRPYTINTLVLSSPAPYDLADLTRPTGNHHSQAEGRSPSLHDTKPVTGGCDQIYLTWVRPSMEYACPVWSASISAEESMALERVQASVARRILSAEWITPKSALLKRLKWPTLWWRRAVLSVCLLYRRHFKNRETSYQRMYLPPFHFVADDSQNIPLTLGSFRHRFLPPFSFFFFF